MQRVPATNGPIPAPNFDGVDLGLILPVPGLVSKILAHLFFLLFTSPVLSPSTGTSTIYLFWFVPLFEVRFLLSLKDVLTRSISRAASKFIPFLIFASYLAVVSPMDAIRLLLLAWTLAYLLYAYDSKLFFCNTWVGFNILIAMMQVSALMVGGLDAAEAVGPTNIGKMIWGSYATDSYTNFYSIVPGFDFPRFSGLSREGGFFASLIISSLLLSVYERKWPPKIFVVGILLSLSKSTLLLIPAWIIVRFLSRWKDFNSFLWLPLFFPFAFTIFYYTNEDLLNGKLSETFIDRFFLYSTLFDHFDPLGFIFGNNISLTDIGSSPSFRMCELSRGYDACMIFPSFANIILISGVLGFILYIWACASFGIGFFGIFLLIILTATVTPLTSTSFVVIGYFLAHKLKTPASLNQEKFKSI